jgi:hypothetical protein
MVNTKLSVCLTKYHAKKAYGEVNILIHICMTLALCGGEWSASCPSWSIHSEEEM